MQHRPTTLPSWQRIAVATAVVAGIAAAHQPAAIAEDKPVELLNVSYDPTRELWKA